VSIFKIPKTGTTNFHIKCQNNAHFCRFFKLYRYSKIQKTHPCLKPTSDIDENSSKGLCGMHAREKNYKQPITQVRQKKVTKA